MGFRGLMLAPPGAGKGTQGKILCDRMEIAHLSTGEILRRHVANGTEYGQRAEAIMAAGELVPDDMVIAMVFERLDEMGAEAGFVLDGFPRTLNQAERLYERGLALGRLFDAVLYLDVDDDELVRRLLERGQQSGRSDDTIEIINSRLEVYRRETEPLEAFYDNRRILHRINGTGTVDEVAARIWNVVSAIHGD